jgi:lipopolysaccharide transport system ATP-binding protein
VSQPAIVFEGAGKKFSRSLSASILHRVEDALLGLVGRPPPARLRAQEFWALRDVSLAVAPGECLGIVGPNGAGKSTLLKLAAGEFRADAGRVATRGRVQPLLRLGAGLMPLLTGRENIQAKCAELGLGQREADALRDGIVAFAGLEKHLDVPVKQYSDGMYARLEFSIATSVQADILLVDEALATGDIAFQMRCLERLRRFKQAGSALLFVSHSEMNVRQIADRCLLLFDGEALALGATDPLLLKYYESVGYLDRVLRPLGLAPEPPVIAKPVAWITRPPGREDAPFKAQTGQPLALALDYAAEADVARAVVRLEFWNTAGALVAALDSAQNGAWVDLARGGGGVRADMPFLGLTPGFYRVAGGFLKDGAWLGYSGELLRLAVTGEELRDYRGAFALQAEVGLGRGGR